MSAALAEIAALVHHESGIRLSERQNAFLQAALDRLGWGSDPEALLRGAADPARRAKLVTRLLDEVTIKETSFLRDGAQLAGIDWRRLLERARARGDDHVRVWTAACATGEEAYSLALLASEAFAPDPAPVRILATDISPVALARARVGAYRQRSVRELDAGARQRWFRQDGPDLVVGPELRRLVTFRAHNLVRDPFPPLGETAFDLILCRNVLIYFDEGTVTQVLRALEGALAPSGQLVLGAADVLCASASRMADRAAPPGPGSAWPWTPRRPLRRPLGRVPDAIGAEVLAPPEEPAELHTPEAVIAHATAALTRDPLDAEANFRRGLAQLESGDPAAAVGSLRGALYAEPRFGLAAFKLGGAHEVLGDLAAARRAYEQALRAFAADEHHEDFLGQIDVADVRAAAQSRLDALGAPAG